MRTVHKFPVSIRDNFDVIMPVGAEIMSFHTQRQELFMWVLVDPNEPRVEKRSFRFAGTGHPIEEENLRFIGTILIRADSLVFHLFEVLK